MKTMQIGKSDLTSSRLAYGCWRVAGTWNPAEVTPSSEAAGRAAILAAYEATSPFVIWQYQPSAFVDGPSYTAQIHSHNGLQLTGYQYSPATITPGEAVHVTLFWQATRPLTTTFHTVVRIVSTVDQSAWAQRDLHSPRSLTPDWIGAGDHFAERFV
jgi:hypothetical protein